MFFPPNLTLTDRFAQLIGGFHRALSAQSNTQCRVAGPLLLLVWNRLCGMRNRFTALAARVRAGTLPAPAPPRQRAATPRPAAAPDFPKLPPLSSGWLLRMVPEPWHLNAWRTPLQELLADPEMAAVVQAAPQMGRILRPLCHMLHEEPPPYLLLPKRPRRPRPARPAKPKPPKFMDINRMSAVAWGNFVHPEHAGQHHPPNRIGYGGSWWPPKKPR
jgi:hypothetical protein